MQNELKETETSSKWWARQKAEEEAKAEKNPKGGDGGGEIC